METVNIDTRKLKLISIISDLSNASIISDIEKLLKGKFNIDTEAVAYTIDGKPLTQEAYNKHIERVINDVEKGNFHNYENVLKEMSDG